MGMDGSPGGVRNRAGGGKMLLYQSHPALHIWYSRKWNDPTQGNSPLLVDSHFAKGIISDFSAYLRISVNISGFCWNSDCNIFSQNIWILLKLSECNIFSKNIRFISVRHLCSPAYICDISGAGSAEGQTMGRRWLTLHNTLFAEMENFHFTLLQTFG